MERRWIEVVVVGIMTRLGLFALRLVPHLNREPELVTGYSSFGSVQEGVFLNGLGRSPYEGDQFRLSPLVLSGFEMLLSATENSFVHYCLFVVVDVLIAYVIYETVSCLVNREGGEENDPMEGEMLKEVTFDMDKGLNSLGNLDFFNTLVIDQDKDKLGFAWLDRRNVAIFASLVYMLNPYTVLCCGGMSLSGILTFWTLLAFYLSLKNVYLLTELTVAVMVNLDILHVFMAVPIMIQVCRFHRQSTVRMLGRSLLFWGLSCGFSLLIFGAFVKQQTYAEWMELLFNAHLKKMTLTDLSPNIGLWWYFFIEMFDQSRNFFLFVFQITPLLYIVPLSWTFRNRPQLLCHLFLIIYQVYKPYPDFSGIGLVMTLMSMHPRTLQRMPRIVPYTVILCFTSCMLPIMRHMWLHVGSGNANYYYFQTLILQFALANLVITFLRASIIRDVHINHYMSTSNSNKAKQE